jgi:hypothetical protein
MPASLRSDGFRPRPECRSTSLLRSVRLSAESTTGGGSRKPKLRRQCGTAIETAGIVYDQAALPDVYERVTGESGCDRDSWSASRLRRHTALFRSRQSRPLCRANGGGISSQTQVGPTCRKRTDQTLLLSDGLRSWWSNRIRIVSRPTRGQFLFDGFFSHSSSIRLSAAKFATRFRLTNNLPPSAVRGTHRLPARFAILVSESTLRAVPWSVRTLDDGVAHLLDDASLIGSEMIGAVDYPDSLVTRWRGLQCADGRRV